MVDLPKKMNFLLDSNDDLLLPADFERIEYEAACRLQG